MQLVKMICSNFCWACTFGKVFAHAICGHILHASMLLSDLFEEFGNDTSLDKKNQLVKISELCKQKLTETSDSTRNLVS